MDINRPTHPTNSKTNERETLESLAKRWHERGWEIHPNALKDMGYLLQQTALEAKIEETTMWQSVAGTSGITEVDSFKARLKTLKAKQERKNDE